MKTDDAEEKAIDAILRTILALAIHSELLLQAMLRNGKDAEMPALASRLSDAASVARALIRVPIIEKLLRQNGDDRFEGWFDTLEQTLSIETANDAFERVSKMEKGHSLVFDIGRTASLDLGYKLFGTDWRNPPETRKLLDAISELAAKDDVKAADTSVRERLGNVIPNSHEAFGRVADIAKLSVHERVEAVVALRDAELDIVQRGKKMKVGMHFTHGGTFYGVS
jgi:hypothetical protein